uniref:TGF-beta propeptide domain-containing protein n=1 Tax=Mesocestoides corti TaxID=53468 RepID=A0A5K3FPH6_MESCO
MRLVGLREIELYTSRECVEEQPMMFVKLLVFAFLIVAFASVDAMKIKSREDVLRALLSELQPGLLKRLQSPGDTDPDFSTLLELYGLEKRRMTPYSGGIFGR